LYLKFFFKIRDSGAGIVDTGGKFATGTTTPAEPVSKLADGVIDTSGKFATCVVDTGGAP
jgi:hypothetical protein